MGYTLTELQQQVADYKAELPVLLKAREIYKANYYETTELDFVIRDLQAGLDYAEKLLELVD